MKLLPPPGPERRRQLTWLVILLAVIGSLAWYEFGRTVPAEPHAAASNSRASGPGQVGPLVLPDPVRLGALASESEVPESGRNLFRFGVKPPPPMPAGGAAGNAPKGPPPPPPPPPGPPPIGLKFLGWVERPDIGKVVTLKDPTSGALFQACEGQVVDGRYRVVRIGLESVVVSYVDGTGQRTIQVGG